MDANEMDLTLVRDILTREVETINFYQRLMYQAQSNDVKDFLKHIIEEEKEHVAEALELIKEYDPAQAALLESGNHWREINAQTVVNEINLEARDESQRPLISNGLTVGSLRKR
jgi:rubrerythrin